ncbi:CHAT domain-containing protein [Microlunatus antarcticus]|uniref:Tetratricopeptide (TPR) repeat protein n=1 Tax=Microlunatus antarcticus TaxID=53388 RepID=A0A7W5JSI2_9ACTN|nr:CHAT domain-containing protein [Microlunatus antarcticus]MBB3325413.1 tetratricopeptide (TPR) repeat protein [Microlunatus antarcticus]
MNTSSWQFAAFIDLDGYIQSNADPDGEPHDENFIVRGLGEWLTSYGLGAISIELSQSRQPVLLTISSSAAGAEVLAYKPWEIALVNGVTLAEQQVNFILDKSSPRTIAKSAVGDRLRMLGVFSHPEGLDALNLRRERYELVKLIHSIAAVGNKAIELKVLQYGATRTELTEALLEGSGWDIIHISGHGSPGSLVLESSEGLPDFVTSDDLLDILEYNSDQLKLITISTCNSATLVAHRTLESLGFAQSPITGTAASAQTPGFSVAGEVVEKLDCTALAMRYPVEDDFAVAFASEFYDILLGKAQPVAKALSLALRRNLQNSAFDFGALCAATPMLVGERAATLSMVAPAGRPIFFDPADLKLAGLPPEPDRFVGRVSAMSAMREVLAPQSKYVGALLHGMAGTGKTTMALEVAYNFQHSFQVVIWFEAPTADVAAPAVDGALLNFALELERRIPGLALIDVLTTGTELSRRLTLLTEFLAQNRVLVLIDNIESLLTADASWRDARWSQLISALTSHAGLSRVVFTTRRVPTNLNLRVRSYPVHALSLEESALLARELPHLRQLIDGTSSEAGVSAAAGRNLAARALRLMQGHPKLVELCDAQAKYPSNLRMQLDDAEKTWIERGVSLEAFWAIGASNATGDDYFALLRDWTRSVFDALPAGSKGFLAYLSALEEGDRISNVVQENWQSLLVATSSNLAEWPDVDKAVGELVSQALIRVSSDGSGRAFKFEIHPAVAETVLSASSTNYLDLVARTLGDFWLRILDNGLSHESLGGGSSILHAARSGLPYLARSKRWADVDFAAQGLINRDLSPLTAAIVIPFLDVAIAAETDQAIKIYLARTRARALTSVDLRRATAAFENLLVTSVQAEEWEVAYGLAGDVANGYMDLSIFDQAFIFAEQQIDYVQRAGRGPWTQLLAQGTRLEVAYLMGDAKGALEQGRALYARIPDLPYPPGPTDSTVIDWNVRESLLNTLVLAARQLRLWDEALAINGEINRSQVARGAAAGEQASDAFHSWQPLVELGRLPLARDLLQKCRQIFESEGRLQQLAETLAALAEVELLAGRADLSAHLHRKAERLRDGIDKEGRSKD